MQKEKVIVQVDWTTKVILVLIAVLLAGLLVKPYITTEQVGAYRRVQPVEVVGGEIGAYITEGTVDVDEVDKVNRVVEVSEVDEVKELKGGRVDVYFPSAYKVVDWKEWEDYQDWFREKYNIGE